MSSKPTAPTENQQSVPAEQPDRPLSKVIMVVFSYSLLVVANGLLSTIFAVRGKIEGFSDTHIGFFGTAYFLGMLIGAIYVKRIILRMGYIRSFASFASIVSILALVPIMMTSSPIWIIARLLAGFFQSGLLLVVEGWVNTCANNTNRGRVMGFYMLMNYGAMATGQLLLMSADPEGFRLFTTASILLSFAVLPLLLTEQAAPSLAEVKPMSPRQVFNISPLGVTTVFSNGLINSTLFSLSPLLVHSLGFSSTQTSFYMAFLVVGGLAVQWPLGKLSDRMDRRYLVILVCLIGSVLVLSTTTMMQFMPNYAFISAFFMGGILLTLYPISTAHTHDYATPDQSVQVASSLLIAWGVGASMGPTLAVATSNFFGPVGIYYFIIVVCAVLGCYTLYRSLKRESMPSHRRHKTPMLSNIAQPNFSRLRGFGKQKNKPAKAAAARDNVDT